MSTEFSSSITSSSICTSITPGISRNSTPQSISSHLPVFEQLSDEELSDSIETWRGR